MHDRPSEEISHSRETDVGMGAHFKRPSLNQLKRPEAVKEDKRTDCPVFVGGQSALHVETADVPAARHDHRFDGWADMARDALGIVCGVPTHTCLQQTRDYRADLSFILASGSWPRQ